MKTITLVLSLMLAAGLAGLAVYQQKNVTRLEQQLAAAQEQLDTLNAELAAVRAAAEQSATAQLKAKVLQETLSQASAISLDQSNQVAQLEQSLAAAKTNSPGLSRLFQDPEMKEMIKAQQKAFMGPMIDRNYAALFQQLGLNKEQADHVKALIEKKMLVAADMGMSMLDGSSDPAKRKELADKVKADTDAVDREIAEFLGADNHKILKDHEASIPDRMSVSQYKDQVAGTGAALNSGQEQQLIDTMSDLRKNFKWTTDYNNQTPPDGNMSAMFSEDRLTQHAREQERYNQELLAKAQTFMTAEQLNSFKTYLENQRKMQEAAMKMAGRMMSP
ncbi:MAG TPA: hypothetical protein VEH04_11685 [Verrucomicrobiae bacterium]|nr:hypothetical protein [Verrucomicrobiae bacterium]